MSILESDIDMNVVAKSIKVVRETTISNNRDFISWLYTRQMEASRREILIELFRSLPTRLFANSDAQIILENTAIKKLQQIYNELEEYVQWVMKQHYILSFSNNTSNIVFDEVICVYTLRDAGVQLLSLQSLGLPPLFPGQTVVFRGPTCVNAVNYAYAFYVNDRNVYQSPTMDVGEINSYEKQIYGQISISSDTWQICDSWEND
jgi:hypothetical protein